MEEVAGGRTQTQAVTWPQPQPPRGSIWAGSVSLSTEPLPQSCFVTPLSLQSPVQWWGTGAIKGKKKILGLPVVVFVPELLWQY